MELSAVQTWDIDWVMEQYMKIVEVSFPDFEEVKKRIPPENFIDIQYEEFIRNPMPFMEQIYQQFGLEGFSEVKPAIQVHLDRKKDYKSNTYTMTQEGINAVNEHWDEIREKFGYTRMEKPM